jgi:hypothetical protein
MSAADSPSAWDLKCDVREHLVTFIRTNFPDALPRFRVETPETRAGVPWTADLGADPGPPPGSSSGPSFSSGPPAGPSFGPSSGPGRA